MISQRIVIEPFESFVINEGDLFVKEENACIYKMFVNIKISVSNKRIDFSPF